MTEVTVTHHPERRRYEAELDGVRVGLIDYRERGDLVALTHTEVNPDVGGRGIGGELVRHALDDLRERGKQVDPVCPFVRSWIERHPDYADLVA